jgi:hypothetical protein
VNPFLALMRCVRSRPVRRLAFFSLMPLSVVPIIAIVPHIAQQYDVYRVKHFARSADTSVPTPAAVTWKLVPTYSGVPVLLYHGINDKHDTFSVSRQAFADQMSMLQQAGFHTISLRQFDAWKQGSSAPLPSRPILITFDDGRFDSWSQADAILARYGFRATMFVIASCPDEHAPSCLSWSELRKAQASGRWDLQEHAGYGHIRIDINADGEQDSYYANLGMVGGRLETFKSFQSRVTSDIKWGDQRLFQELPDYRRLAFAVPYGNYGQVHSNDPRIKGFMSSWLQSKFHEIFLVFPYAFVTRQTPTAALPRVEVHTKTTTEELYCWLRVHAPGAGDTSPGCRTAAASFVATANAE